MGKLEYCNGLFPSSEEPVYFLSILNLFKPPDPVKDKVSETENDKVSEEMSVLDNVKVVVNDDAIVFY